MEKYDIVIIGSGLGGLLCGNILSKEGYKICILEQNKRIGGTLQSFARNKVVFNTGLNYTESLGEGEILNKYFKYFGIIDKLKCRRMDLGSFERMLFKDDENQYPFAQGGDNFVESLSSFFPAERQNLKTYIADLKSICKSFPLYSLDGAKLNDVKYQGLIVNAHKYIEDITKDRKLQTILGGMNSLYAGVADKTPLYVHALINNSFINSAWRLVDGSSQLAVILASNIKANGGEIILNSKVTQLGGSDRLEYAQLADGNKIFGKSFISNLHPAPTLNMVQDAINKQGLRQRINSLQNTIGMFSLYIVLKPDSFPYYNYNFHYFNHLNAWTTSYNEQTWPSHYMLYTPAISVSEKWAKGLIAITYMDYKDVEKWKETSVENRGDEYLEFKQQKTEILLKSIEIKFPDIRNHIAYIYSSTPLTYRDYTGTPEGSAYGILKDYTDPLSTIISPRSRVKNLYFTGQNLNMHGILGVSIGAVMTCAEFIGLENILEKIRKC